MESRMTKSKLNDCLERSPVIASFHEHEFEKALGAPPEILFDLKASLPKEEERIKKAHVAGKAIFVHIDLADGIGKDKTGIEYLASLGVDGIISTRGQMIKYAREAGLLTVQRFFALDTKGLDSIHELLESSAPDLIEIIPGVISKVIERFSGGSIPVIAGGLIETKAEVTAALASGAAAVSTGMHELWYI
ncbi:MAG: glycerol-3-phosphate responsive antiterminator [Clostridia bacterium]|nr:glycerol-3-phosphate responsive antiterminator [Clostridia bacterium]